MYTLNYKTYNNIITYKQDFDTERSIVNAIEEMAGNLDIKSILVEDNNRNKIHFSDMMNIFRKYYKNKDGVICLILGKYEL